MIRSLNTRYIKIVHKQFRISNPAGRFVKVDRSCSGHALIIGMVFAELRRPLRAADQHPQREDLHLHVVLVHLRGGHFRNLPGNNCYKIFAIILKRRQRKIWLDYVLDVSFSLAYGTNQHQCNLYGTKALNQWPIL